MGGTFFEGVLIMVWGLACRAFMAECIEYKVLGWPSDNQRDTRFNHE